VLLGAAQYCQSSHSLLPILIGLHFSPEDGDETFFRNASEIVPSTRCQISQDRSLITRKTKNRRDVYNIYVGEYEGKRALRGLRYIYIYIYIYIFFTQWTEYVSELYRPSERRLSAKSAPAFADRGCHVVSMTDPYGNILGFLGRT
jgi:hypothetical protein